jgi:hypothetical protein
MARTKELELTDKNPYTDLNINQRRYVEARLQGLPQGAACRAIGVSQDTGATYDRSPKVRKAIKYLICDTAKNVKDLTKSDVMEGMMDAVHSASTSTELVNAWRELGKLIGAYEPERKVIELHDFTREELKTLSEDELLRMSGSRYKDAIDGEYRELTSSPNDRELTNEGSYEQATSETNRPDLEDSAEPAVGADDQGSA